MDANESPQRAGEPIVEVGDVSMIFNIASERLDSLKEYFLKIVKHELMF